ncbi:Epsin-1 [Taenia solium]|eukprot:TsM_000437400 transcript=TsM_000437400 gene=TsM_000437400
MMPLQRHIKNVVHNYTEAERKVREATSNDPWGPSSTLMSEIADRTYNVIAFTEIMQMIWRRLNDKSKNWRHVYKALILLEYIIKTGSDKVAVQCRENIHAIETLMDFYYVEDGKDVGNSVREKARSLNALLRDDERLQEERAKALLARERLMHGGALGTSAAAASAYSPPLPFARAASAFGDDRRPSSQPSSLSAATGGISSDLDSAQPQSYTEEQLQLQLALAISKEEHERELQKRHEEEAKEALKLQMVLEQSKREEQNRSAAASLISEANSTGGGGSASMTGNGGGLFSLIDTSLSAAPANMPDPWSTIVPAPVPAATAPSNSNHSNALVAATLPFDNSAYHQSNNTNSSGGVGNQLSLIDSPWTPKDTLQSQRSHAVPVANNNPWAALDPVETALPSTALTLAQNGTSSGGICGSGVGPITSAVSTTAPTAASTTSSSGAAAPSTPATTVTPTRKRTPADFLGDHKDLVDLEKLVDRNPASTNPFATSTRPLTGQSTNPFSANQPPKPSLNQLSSAAAAAAANGTALTTLGGRLPSAFTSFTPQRAPFMASGPTYFPGQVAPTSTGAPQQSQLPQQQQQSLNPFF